MLLILVAAAVAAWLVLAAVARLVPRVVMTAVRAGICGAVVVVALADLVAGADMTELALPLGPAGAAMHVALDPLAASFLLLLFLVMACANVPPLPLAGMAVTLIAADGFALAVGLLLLAGVASLRAASFAVVCLTVALALASVSADFAEIRAATPDGWRAAAMLLLVLAAAGALIRINTTVAIYLVIRIVFDLCGPGQPLWWGVPLVLAGAGVAVIAALRAAIADTLHGVLSAGSFHQFGMAAIGLGVALFARAADLPSLAAGALGAVWLALVCHTLCRTLLLRCGDAVECGAATHRLDLLGGLIRHMPITAGCCLLGLFAIAALPPGLGFAGLWLLLQSLLGAARIGGIGLQLLVIAVVTLTGLSVGLIALASVRLFGVVFLGRPRTPRAAAPDEAPRQNWIACAGLAALTGMLGVFPALAFVAATGWTGLTATGQWFTLHISADLPGYSPVALALPAAIVAFAVLRLVRRPGAQRREPAWSDGFAAPPAWLPFGDPATQFGPVSFSEPLPRMLALLPSPAAAHGRLVRWRDALLRAATALDA